VKIPITRPYFDDAERKAILEPLETGWVVQGPKVAEFERLFAEFVGSRFAVATTSCTTALHLAAVVSGVGPGDEVIVPSLTWVATANIVEETGARPVFVDVCLDTFNVDPRVVLGALTSRTRALIPVSLFGLSAPMSPLVAIARARELHVIEDDACALGAYEDGRHAGLRADMACFSFHPRKAITTGEGGMVVTDSEGQAVRLRSLRDHGASTSDLARHHSPRSYELPAFNVLGFNYRMTDFQGALGVAQMQKLPWILAQRRRVAERYDTLLAEAGWLRTPRVPEGSVHGYQSYVCLFAPETPTLANVESLHRRRNRVMDTLQGAGISTRPGTHAVHMLGFYSLKYNLHPEDFPNSYMADRLSLTLPLSAQMTEDEQQYVVDAVRRIVP
jgi:perosamine synthetase